MAASKQPQPPNPAQERFNAKYISASEIAKDLRVSRPSVMRARERNALPGAVLVGDGNIYIWERETVRPFVDAWRITLQAKRRQPA
jgi:hypothetical protein